LQPLAPRYVSTVDSGNLAASLLILKWGCQNLPDEAILDWRRWQGLLDTLSLLAEAVSEVGRDQLHDASAPLLEYLEQVRQSVLAVRDDSTAWVSLLSEVSDRGWAELERLILNLVESDVFEMDSESLRNLRIFSQRVQHHLYGLKREVDMLLPWYAQLSHPPAVITDDQADSFFFSAWQDLLANLPPTVRLTDMGSVSTTGEEILSELRNCLVEQASLRPDESFTEALAWCDQLKEKLSSARISARALIVGYQEISRLVDNYYNDTDFGFLYDPQRRIFHLGFNVDGGRLDPNYYDLLASEARIASLIAIARRDVPQSHWLHLARPLTQLEGRRVLLSWSGTMFEYMLPPLLMRSYVGTLLHQSSITAVDHQIAYGKEKNVPWGVSESGYYGFDANLNYQYRAFGVPGLGFKRGLGEELVIAPYASMLALSIRPQELMENFQRLVKLGMLRTYGFYEAIDFTPAHLALGQESAIVRSFMAHHQGMILLSLVNYLKDEISVRRFHSDPMIQSVELLLQEMVPQNAPLERLHGDEDRVLRPTQAQAAAIPWQVPVVTPVPQVHVLSNGRFSTLLTGAGGGFSRWEEIDLNRWRADPTLDAYGAWIYVKDYESGAIWSAGYQPTAVPPDNQEVNFYPHMAEFRRRDGDISLVTEIIIPPQEDIEIRSVTLTNHSGRPHRLELTSYAEVILAPQATDQRHPAFNKLFIESEYLPELNVLLFRRRPRSQKEEPIFLAHFLVSAEALRSDEAITTYESDRNRFIGRGQTTRAPAALSGVGERLSGTTGATLDPIMALRIEIDLEPHESEQVAFITLVAKSRPEALALARRYQDWPVIGRAEDLARSYAEAEMRRLGLITPDLERIQRLLSVLLQPHRALRAAPEVLAANQKGQSGLWGYAISGDYPILLMRLDSPEDTPLLGELLKAHAYWRNRDLKIDLVILNRRETGYAQELTNQLHRLIARMGGENWLNRRGGIFLLRADQMSPVDQVLLETSARAILDGDKGSLESQLQGILALPAALPPFIPTQIDVKEAGLTPLLERPADLLFDNGMGGFTPDGSEYVIYLQPGQWSPLPWTNVIANEQFGFLVTEAGSGYTWSVNSGENRLTPWSNDPVSDPPGEAIYLRDEETSEVWSPTPLPARDPAPYLIRHGAGYSMFEHHSHGLIQHVRFFLAPDEPVKVVQLRLENTWNRVRRITATFYAEWVLGVDHETAQQYIVPDFDAECQALLARNVYNTEFVERVAFASASHKLHGLTADRAEFLGRMGSRSRPAALERIGLSGRVEAGDDPCAALQVHLDLQPGEVAEVHFLLGQGENRDHALRLARRYQLPELVAAAWSATTQFWEDLLGTIQVDTPDSAMNLLMNRWLLYQALSCRIWGRSAFYQSSGAYGFRDQLQDVMSVIFAAPQVARAHLIRAARHQFEAGDVLHWWHPPAGRGVRTRISDDLLWLPYVTAHYVSATGDDSVLDERVPFLKGLPLEPGEEERYGLFPETTETHTLYEHCIRSLERGATSGPHNLPLIGGGDWNDGMNRVGIEGQGESVWLGWFIHLTLERFARICERRGALEQAALFQERAAQYSQALEASAWDGEWYLRAFYDDGAPLGSSRNRECQIDSIAQSWAVLSRAGDPERARRAMESVASRLIREQDRLILLFTPPFDKTSRDPGYIRGYLPGIRENGGQYTHGALWTVWAYSELGQGDRAEALFRLLNPIYHSDHPEKMERYKVEPYVIAADVYGVAPHTGRGGWTWYTGSSGWAYRLGMEAILGLNLDGAALRIDPCIPKSWPGYQLVYRFGQTKYHIRVDNPGRVNRGVAQILLDGETLVDGRIELLDDGGQHEILVRMG
jgi:cyclic beta-1,2-glucan synthetase